ncbi:hypothetical protein AMQ84_07010 [Paenibacillus riograndensis]|uniref:DUF4352 domain-containing protein n=1 Tax=Paenibacillus riograndensis TaxID=483937 RepID=A0A132U760_9BACL|nr:DUF4352 domain-containing protein [Paenibacillus riograndensis]KWX79459.1 hypothetical protein AMQ84_07010 [Paenibacillus riograndensis]
MKKFFKMGCLGFIVLVAIIIIIGIFASNGDDKSNNANNSTNSAGTVEKKDAAKEKAKKLKKKGEELQVGDVVFKVNKVTTTKEIKDNFLSYSPSADGSVFLVVNVTVKNVGKEMITTDSSFFQLLKGEVEYNPSTLITTKGDYFLYEGINPGLAQTGNVVFEIPEDMKDFVLNVQTGFWGTEQGQIELK